MTTNEILKDAGIFSLQEDEWGGSTSTSSSSFHSHSSISYSSFTSESKPNPYMPIGFKAFKKNTYQNNAQQNTFPYKERNPYKPAGLKRIRRR